MANNPRHLRPSLIYTDDVISYFAEMNQSKNKKVRIIQVGANDGKNNDPVHHYIKNYNWEGILVEPQEYVFKNELSFTYAGNDLVHLENVAIADQEGELPFYKISFTNARWATGLATFYRPSIEHQIKKGYVKRKAEQYGDKLPDREEDYIEEVKVKTTSFNNLIKKYNFDNVNFLCIDTEGFDFEVLKYFNFDKYKPDFVLFESKNLNDEDYVEAKTLLLNNGYKLYWYRGDTIGIRFKLPLFNLMKSKFKAFKAKL